MIPDGNESLGPDFYEKYCFPIFVGSMTSSSTIYQYPLITYDVIEVGAQHQKTSKHDLKSSCKVANSGVFLRG